MIRELKSGKTICDYEDKNKLCLIAPEGLNCYPRCCRYCKMKGKQTNCIDYCVYIKEGVEV